MKKGLALLLAASMSLSAFSTAFAAEQTAQEKFDALKAKGIFEGVDAAGNAGLDQNMNRAQFATVLQRLMGLEDGAPAAATFTDVNGDQWWYGAIEAAVAAGLINGMGDGTFAPKADVTYEQLAKLVVEALKIEVDADAAVDGTVSPGMAGYVKAAIDAGLFAAQADYKAPVKREVLVEATFVAEAEINAPAVLAVESAAQAGAKKIEVKFNKAAAEDVAVVVKSGYLTVDGTVEFAADRKSATFTAANDLVAGDYTVEATGAEAKTVTVEAAKVDSFELTTAAIKAGATSEVAVKTLNQFGEEMAPAANAYTVNVYRIPADTNVQAGALTAAYADGKITITDAVVEKDKVVVSLIETATAKSVTKEYTVVAASTLSSVKLGTVAPKTDEARIYHGDQNLVLPVELYDQYGEKMTLGNALPQGLSFFTSNNTLIPKENIEVVAVDQNDLTKGYQVVFDAAGAVNTPATAVTISALVQSTSSLASTSVSLNPEATLKAVTVTQPQGLVVQGEPVTVAYEATNTYGDKINLDLATPNLVWFSNNTDAVNPATDIAVDNDGKLTVKPSGTGVATLSLYYQGALQGTINLDVKAEAKASKITGLSADALSTIAVGADYTYNGNSFVIVDQYNRVIKADDLDEAALTLAEKTAADDKVGLAGKVVTANNAGSQVLVATYDDANSDALTYEFTVNAVTDSQVTGYEVEAPAITTILSAAGLDANSDFAATLNLKNGLTADGTKVAVAPGFDALVSSDASFSTDAAAGKVWSATAENGEETVIIAVKKGKQVAQVTLKTSTNQSAPATLSFADDVATEITTANDGYDFEAKLAVKDQYGVDFAKSGTWYSSDATVLDVDAATGVATIDAAFTGEKDVTVTYVTANAKIISLTVKVKN